jgi:cyclic beta-1,2-glucan synthetase
LVRNPFQDGSFDRTAFVASDRRLHGFTTDRNELFGQGGSRARPAALQRIGLTDSAASGGDPCGALQIHLDLPPSGAIEAHFLLGEAVDRATALELITRFRVPEAVRTAHARVRTFWDDLSGSLEVETPEPELDLLANGWLLYQALSCRLWARGALYQAGGAYGFRDQLQDASAFLVTLPRLARDHIVRAASRQFEAGDVLHWWHPGTSRGVRTRCSDDLLWLPWTVAEYLEVTGDRSVLDETAPWLTETELDADQTDRYDLHPTSGETASVYEHCLRAIERGTTRGAHGLPLIGSCDWNDALSRVGIEGSGESVWLGWFLCTVLRRFAAVCDERGDAPRAAAMRRAADGYRDAIEAHGWDGAWYLRAFFDDGSPLGTAGDAECEIDLLAQSWAVLSGEAPPSRAKAAMEAAYERLLSREPGVIRLLAPPFRGGRRDPGYIQAYPPGVRENGGQYNHAAIWAAWAFAALGDGERALELERLVNPLCRAHDRESALRYRLEPYAVAGDVATSSPHQGRGGWSWYTGSAAWLYRLIVEAILGIRRRGGRLEVDPCIPASWPGFRATVRHGATAYRLRVENPEGVRRGVRGLWVDGQPVAGDGVLLVDDARQHEVLAILGHGLGLGRGEGRPASAATAEE